MDQSLIEKWVEDLVEKKLDARLGDGFLSMEQLRSQYGISRTWIYRQHANGHLTIYKIGGKTRVRRSELERLAIPL